MSTTVPAAVAIADGRPTHRSPSRRLVAAVMDSDPSMDEALRRARRIEALDRAAHAAASYVRSTTSAR